VTVLRARSVVLVPRRRGRPASPARRGAARRAGQSADYPGVGASDVVIGAGGGQVLIEFGEAMSVGACGGIEQGSRASSGVACTGQFQYVHVGAGPGEQGSQSGQPFVIAQVG